MSNYPNMSYCMFQNTNGALHQILNAMVDAEEDDELGKFLAELSQEERRACRWLAENCRDFLEILEQAEDEEEKLKNVL